MKSNTFHLSTPKDTTSLQCPLSSDQKMSYFSENYCWKESETRKTSVVPKEQKEAFLGFCLPT